MVTSLFKISFIIPTYNRAGVVTRAIESVINQTNSQWELIIIDDGSTDETSTVVQDYLIDNRINYFYQSNNGTSHARNAGAEKARGEFLIFLDSDDILFPDLIDKLYVNRFLDYDLIFWEVIKQTNGKVSRKKPVNLGKMYNNIKATFLSGSVCYRRKIFDKVGGYDPLMTFGENYELGLRIAQIKNIKIKYIKEPFLKYIVDTSNRTSNSFSNRLNSHFHQLQKHKEKYKKDSTACSTMNYLIAFIFEKTNRKAEAIKYYKESWSCSPWNIKPVLKILYLNLIK